MVRFSDRFAVYLLLILLLPSAAGTACAAPRDSDPQAMELLARGEALMRGRGTEGVYAVRIIRPEWERTLRLRTADDAQHERYRLEMLEPRKVKGMLFLRINGRLSMYLPKLRREISISPAMMHDPWMGSDFNNQDLLESAALLDGYQHRILTRDADKVIIESVPKADAAVTWSRLEQALSPDAVPREVRYFNQKGQLERTLRFEDVRPSGGRSLPMRWVMQPAARPGQRTEIQVEEVQVDVLPAAALFELPAAGTRH